MDSGAGQSETGKIFYIPWTLICKISYYFVSSCLSLVCLDIVSILLLITTGHFMTIVWPGNTFSMPVSLIRNQSCNWVFSTRVIIICQTHFTQSILSAVDLMHSHTHLYCQYQLKSDDEIPVNQQLQAFFFHHRTHFWWWRRVMMIYICLDKCFIAWHDMHSICTHQFTWGMYKFL